MRKPTLPALYAAELARHGYEPDPSQRQAVERLEALRLELKRSAAARRSLAARVRSRMGRAGGPKATPGIYLWGGVGRGKTFLMDLFESCAPVPARRAHFHHFMRDVTERLNGLRETPDPLGQVADQLAGEARLICLDELYVSDVANAMIMAALLEALHDRGVTLVYTSNTPPGGLYPGGLQRQRFLPAIALLEQQNEIIHLDGGRDYRLRQLQRAPLYVSTSTYDADVLLQQRFAAIAGRDGEPGGTLDIDGRPIPVRRRTHDVVWFDFAALCDGPRSVNDYIEIARSFHTVVVSGVPRFGPARDDEARRFIGLVDEFYDRGVKLVVSADAPPDDLYHGQRLAFEFQRTSSRLTEMQSHLYLERPHRP